jgi:hypothetical protein
VDKYSLGTLTSRTLLDSGEPSTWYWWTGWWCQELEESSMERWEWWTLSLPRWLVWMFTSHWYRGTIWMFSSWTTRTTSKWFLLIMPISLYIAEASSRYKGSLWLKW